MSQVNHKGLHQGWRRLINRYVVERANKAEIRPEEQSEKAESCRENLWNEIQLKGPKDSNRHKNRMKRGGQARLVYAENINRNIPTAWRWACGNPNVIHQGLLVDRRHTRKDLSRVWSTLRSSSVSSHVNCKGNIPHLLSSCSTMCRIRPGGCVGHSICCISLA